MTQLATGTHTDPDRISTVFSAFADHHIKVLPTLGRQDAFPTALWKKMGEAGLLDPVFVAGEEKTDSRAEAIATAGRILVERGGCLGLGLSWLVHHLAGGFLFPRACGPEGAKRFRADFAAGTKTAGLAVSEPGAGAHPKYLATSAETDRSEFILNGEKTYVTNGPIADPFVVVAVTNKQDDKKLFSAFRVPRHTPGLTVLPPMVMPFFKPSPHCGIRLENVRVGKDALMGRADHAWEDLVMPFRGLEDRAMTGLVLGAVERLLVRVSRAARMSGLRDRAPEHLGGMAVTAAVAGTLARGIQRRAPHKDRPWEREAHLIHFRQLARSFSAAAADLLSRLGQDLAEPDAVLLTDLAASAGMGEKIGRLRQIQIGRRLMG